MGRLLWLADVLRAEGLTVFEVDGWRTRGADAFSPIGGICHATAGSPTSTDAGEIRTLLIGSESAPPPISQLYLSRTGPWYVVASGRCNHAKSGQQGTPFQGIGNAGLIGVEAQNDNAGQPWPAVQLASYMRGCAAIARKMGWQAGRWIAHREHQPSGKTDPVGFDMTTFRGAVSRLIRGDDVELSDSTGWSTTQYSTAEIGYPRPALAGQPVGVALQYIREDSHYARQAALVAARESTALREIIVQLVDIIHTGSSNGSVPVPTDLAATILAGVDVRLEALAAEQRDAVADLGEGGAAQVRGPQGVQQ